MIAENRSSDNGNDFDDLPAAWTRFPDESLGHAVVAKYVHQISGQVVRVRRHRWPTQMRDPMASDDDTGYRALVEGDEHSAKLSADLAAESVAREAAREFMGEYPGGDFDVPHPSEKLGTGPVEW